MPRMIAVSAPGAGVRRVVVVPGAEVAVLAGRGAPGARAAVVSATRGTSLAAALERSELSTLQAASSRNRERLRICRGCIGRVRRTENVTGERVGQYRACGRGRAIFAGNALPPVVGPVARRWLSGRQAGSAAAGLRVSRRRRRLDVLDPDGTGRRDGSR